MIYLRIDEEIRIKIVLVIDSKIKINKRWSTKSNELLINGNEIINVNVSTINDKERIIIFKCDLNNM